ncbi:CDP-glycerol glycerophosphotransferase family protein [Enterococcus hulanensis]|uniref:CDP-glycerol glycerophosphotransferase family protein n=1 Tax=Enterococcus hulanensis TaxID=2559929 RepID=UPI001A921CFA|nr:CDP-glycerol glycerophosphotransferase family protein [Enterococcus hulanensis]MBO0411986.1 CDP-glycerol glycerophosphotransferase family protein [Enterococcus hulanensis]
MKYIFCSVPDFSDNARAMFEYMFEREISGTYTWLFNDRQKIEDSYFDDLKTKGVKFLEKNSFSGFKAYLLSNISFSDHGIFNSVPLNFGPKKIELWHGMPLKQIGYYNEDNKIKFHKTISTADIFDPVLEKAFGINSSKIIKTGLPRNDKLLNNNIGSKIFNNDYPIIAWLPTFRFHKDGEYKDGEYTEGKIGFFNLEELEKLDFFLEENQLNLFIKLHPFDVLNDKIDNNYKFKRLKIFRTQDFESKFLDLYEILSTCEALITDYSSVLFDFVITRKPIALMQSDFQKYKDSRGLVATIEESIDLPIITSIEEFREFLANYRDLKINYENQIQMFQSRDFHGSNSEEICKSLNILP